jgi:dihydrolipoamide dehydrogenase
MKFILGTKVTGCETNEKGAKLTYENKKGDKKGSIEAEVCLVAIGRKPYTQNLGLEKLGIKTDKFGRIITDKHFKTNINNIFAIGDVREGPMLAHKAEDEGIACVENIKGLKGHVNYDTIPSVIYTWPEVACIGKTEEDCKKKGIQYKVGRFPFAANSRAKANDDTEGLIKFIAEKESNKLLGVHMLGPNVSEMIHEAAVCMEFGGSSEDIARICHAHPTLSEAVKEAALACWFKAIHC